MAISIRALDDADVEAVVDLALRAWAPVFESIRETLGDRLFRYFFGEDWSQHQEIDVRRALGAYEVLVADDDGRVAAYTAIDLPAEGEEGEIYMIAVDPDAQGRGLGTRLTEAAVERIREAGKRVAVVDTGGDPGHAAARATYAKAGFVAWQSHRFYRLLDDD